MVLGMGSMALAAPEDNQDQTQGQTAATINNLTADDTITVKDLMAGDTVRYYQVLKWDDQNGTGWIAAEGFTDLTAAQVEEIAGKPKQGDTAAVPGKVTAAMAGILGTMAKTATAKGSETISGTEWSAKVEPGLYLVTVVAGNSSYMYNPMIVSADYYQERQDAQGNTIKNTNEWTVTLDKSYSDTALAKKTTIPGTKTASESDADRDGKPETVHVGSILPFKIETTIPAFASNYTDPAFIITDNLTDLELDTDSIEVTPAAAVYDDNDSTSSMLKLVFDKEYLKEIKNPTPVVVTYKAKVTSSALKSVNPLTNDFVIEYSTDPDDDSKHGVIKDLTKHYTFSLDAELFGVDDYITSELVKIGVDKDGKELTQTIETDNGTVTSALSGAEFKLYTDEGCTTEYENDVFHNPITTTDKGLMPIRGLDAGTYYLKETKAPAGYIRNDKVIEITIDATITEKTIKETIDGMEVTYKVNTLDSYKITVDGDDVTTSTYTINYEGTTTTATPSSASASDTTNKIKNVQGTELPATGGMGTTLFYIIGSILVIGAGIVLVAKKRMSME